MQGPPEFCAGRSRGEKEFMIYCARDPVSYGERHLKQMQGGSGSCAEDGRDRGHRLPRADEGDTSWLELGEVVRHPSFLVTFGEASSDIPDLKFCLKPA